MTANDDVVVADAGRQKKDKNWLLILTAIFVRVFSPVPPICHVHFHCFVYPDTQLVFVVARLAT